MSKLYKKKKHLDIYLSKLFFLHTMVPMCFNMSIIYILGNFCLAPDHNML